MRELCKALVRERDNGGVVRRSHLYLKQNLYTILQILSVTLFEKVPLDQLFANFDYKLCADFKEQEQNQMTLFNY